MKLFETSIKLFLGCGLLSMSASACAENVERYYRQMTKQEKAKERTQKPADFTWLPFAEQLIAEMAIDYQNAVFATNIKSMEDGPEKDQMLEFRKKYPEEFGIRSTQAMVVTAIDQLEDNFDLIKDTIIPVGFKQPDFFYNPEEKDSTIVGDLRNDPASFAEYKGKYYETWSFKNDSSETKTVMVFTPLGFEKIHILHREEANIKTDYSELKNGFINAEEQREEIKKARKEFPLDYGQRLGEEYQWSLCDTWKDVLVKPTPTEEEKKKAKKN